MARRHHRKSHRKAHRKSHRKSHRKVHRKVHRKSRRQSRRQRGGFNSCAALPMNREAFAQRGGEAPYVAAGGADYLLDAPTRIQAQVGPLDAAFAELPSVIPRQGGGRRRTHRHKGRRQSRQRGGMSPFGSPGMLLDAAQYANDKTNPQFHTEGSVNPHYGFFKGAQ